MPEHTGTAANGEHERMQHSYGKLALMTVLSFIAMYVLMYAMVNRFANVYSNFNQFYMVGLMTAAMILIELIVMGRMYPKKKLNAGLVIVSIVALVVCWLFIRQQTGIGDRQFLKSMIPHHGGAILMCNEASIKDADIQKLCRGIVIGQQREIDQMKAKLAQLSD